MQTATLRLLKYKIRQAVKDILSDQTVAGSQIFLGRTSDPEHTELPAIFIYADSEGVARFDESYKRYRRNLALKIELINRAETDEDLEYQMEVEAEKIEYLIEQNEFGKFNGLINKLSLTGVQYNRANDGQLSFASVVLEYDFEMMVYALPDGLDLDAFKEVDIEWKLPTGFEDPVDDGLVKANDKIDLPQV